MERTVKDAKTYDRFQFERVGFFSVDPDSAQNKSGRVSDERGGRDDRAGTSFAFVIMFG